MSVAIINYGMGNLASVQKALQKIGIDSIITSDPSVIINSKYILLPGVGSFERGIHNLKEHNLFNLIRNEVLINQKPFFGICLGMQLIASYGTEPSLTEGLNLIEGEVLKMQEEALRIPHLGWNSLISKGNSFFDEYDEKDFYFIHSYHFSVKDIQKIGAKVSYGSEYVAAVQFENIYATQFHPEKSQEFGLSLLKKFFNQYA